MKIRFKYKVLDSASGNKTLHEGAIEHTVGYESSLIQDLLELINRKKYIYAGNIVEIEDSRFLLEKSGWSRLTKI